jgi:nicotinamidase-related amidase
MKPRHPALLDKQNALLLVVDLQEPFLRTVEDRQTLIDRCSFLIKASSILKIPVVVSTQNAARMGGVIPELAEVVAASNGIVLDKMCFSCAQEDQFASELIRLDRNQVIVCGVETHICVLQTALDLTHLDYEVHVPVDAVASRSAGLHGPGIEKMIAHGVNICTADGAVMELLKEAGTPQFKSILRLIHETT